MTSVDTGSTYQTTNPARPDEVVGQYTASTAADATAAVSAAAAALPQWRATPAPARGRLVEALAAGIVDRRDEFARIITAEMGKPLAEAYGEVDRSVQELRFIAGAGFRSIGEILPSGRPGVQIGCLREPLGVVAAITPWNFPLTAPARKLGPALVYGCTTVLKPAEQTPGAAVLLMEVLEQVGVPSGVVNLVTGRGRVLGPALTEDPRVAGISFTGSTEVGVSIAVAAAARNARVQLEMGGKNAALIAGYSDIPGAARQITQAAFQAAGQRCTSISRVITLRSSLGEVEDQICREVGSFVMGDGMDPRTTIGPLATQGQADKCADYIQGALVNGARVLTGGSRADGQFVEPTVLTDVRRGTPAAVEEIFGPVLVIIAVDSIEEMIAVHDEVSYGLTASIFCDDPDVTEHLVAQARTGMVHVNHGTISEAHVPFGGIKDSGMGGYSIGETNADFFTAQKVVYRQYR